MRNFLSGRLLLVRACLLGATLVLVVIGLGTLYGISHPAETSPASNADELTGYFHKQVLFAVMGLVALVAANLVDYRRLGEISYGLYGVILAMLAFVLVGPHVAPSLVPEVKGSYRWIQFHS